jgi:hypothetical protein
MDGVSALTDALAAGHELDLGGATVPAAALAAVLTAAPPAGAPVLRLRRARVSGVLRLTGARVAVPVDLRACTFDEAPDLRMAEFPGLSLSGCRVPALRAGNLRVTADLTLDDGFTAHSAVHLPDAHVGGSLRLSAAVLHGADGRALIADRIVVGGTCYARRLRSDAEVRLPGARITGNFDLSGATLHTGTADALDLTGIAVDGSLLAGRHHAGPGLAAYGRVLMPGARVGGDLVFTGATIHRRPGSPLLPRIENETRMPVVPGGIIDPGAALVADRIRVEGNLELDDGSDTVGTVRLPSAVVSGYVRLSGAHLTGPYEAPDHGVALLADGIEIGGDLEARRSGPGPLVCDGQLRLVDAHVRGSASLSGIDLRAPDRDAFNGDRLRVGGELYLREIRCAGTLRLQNAEIGTTLDCTGARFTRPRRRPLDPASPAPDPPHVRASLDARAAGVGKDLLCVRVQAAGGIRIRRMDVRKSVQIVDATLGGPGARYALNAYGLTTTELVIRPAAAPQGVVRLEQARVGTFRDSENLWADAAVGDVLLDGFAYESLNDTHVIDVRTRLNWIERVADGYAPGSYDHLAAAYRRAGREEMAERVLIARQHRRYAAAGRTARIWGALQRVTVGYGYRPWLAACWLVGLWLLGGTWFAFHEPAPIDAGQNPAWNPWIYAADTLLPIVNLGQDGYWRMAGASQWIAGALVAAGWILATTAAAGAARILKRV